MAAADPLGAAAASRLSAVLRAGDIGRRRAAAQRGRLCRPRCRPVGRRHRRSAGARLVGLETALVWAVRWHLTPLFPFYAMLRDLMLPGLWIDGWIGTDFVWRGNAMSAAADSIATESIATDSIATESPGA